MAVFHDEVEIEDFQYDEDSESYFYPCPCGDNFCITKVCLLFGRLPHGAIGSEFKVQALGRLFGVLPDSVLLSCH